MQRARSANTWTVLQQTCTVRIGNTGLELHVLQAHCSTPQAAMPAQPHQEVHAVEAATAG